MAEERELARLFEYHPPKTDRTKAVHEQIRGLCKELALNLNALLPDSREKSLALTSVQQAMWAANAAIAIHSDVPLAENEELRPLTDEEALAELRRASLVAQLDARQEGESSLREIKQKPSYGWPAE